MKVVLIIITGIITSLFFFPFEFTFLPNGFNTKILLGGVGLISMAYHFIKMGKISISKEVLIASIIAVIFSIACFYSVDINNSNDMAYATYIASMWVWFLASYAVISLIAWVHNRLDIPLVVNYFVAVCVVQCSLALIIDFVPELKTLVDKYVDLGITEFLNRVDRLYGIGAALDFAGVRFSAVLIMIAILFTNTENLQLKNKELYFYSFSYLIIAVIGNMISRTTTIGLGISLFYLLVNSKLFTKTLKIEDLNLWKVLLNTSFIVIFLGIYFYHTNENVQELLRFGFEGFFNWAEKGEWRTDSTDRLNTEMWIWPEANDFRTWLFGKAVFSKWSIVGTDIGYCRFIFYCGLTGLLIFTFFFAYLSYALWYKFKNYRHLFLLLFILALINWLKVSTDIFLVYAIFLSIGSPYLYNKYFLKSA